MAAGVVVASAQQLGQGEVQVGSWVDATADGLVDIQRPPAVDLGPQGGTLALAAGTVESGFSDQVPGGPFGPPFR